MSKCRYILKIESDLNVSFWGDINDYEQVVAEAKRAENYYSKAGFDFPDGECPNEIYRRKGIMRLGEGIDAVIAIDYVRRFSVRGELTNRSCRLEYDTSDEARKAAKVAEKRFLAAGFSFVERHGFVDDYNLLYFRDLSRILYHDTNINRITYRKKYDICARITITIRVDRKTIEDKTIIRPYPWNCDD